MKTLNYKGKTYAVVTELFGGSCVGCVFDDYDVCPNNDDTTPHQCWDEDPEGKEANTILIPNTKKALAEYVARRLGADDENQNTS